MGARGPQPESQERLKLRGSWRARAREKELKEKSKEKDTIPRIISKDDLTDRYLRRVIKRLPGYDPHFGAEDYKFVPKLARENIEFFENELTHVKGEKAGQPFILEAWERAIVANLFGWVHKKTGLRRFREAFIEVGRKNGKTPIAAGILSCLLFKDGEPGAEIYGAASEYKQASLVWTWVAGMVNRNPRLKSRCQIFKGQAKSIEVGQPGDLDYGVYRVICSEHLAAYGFNTHGVVIDELHALPNSDLVDTLVTSTGARRQPLIIYITTADWDRVSVCNEKEKYAKSVRDKIIHDPTFLPVIYEASPKDDWTKLTTWKKANPNLDVSISREYLAKECKRARENPRYENIFKRLHLNIKTQQEIKWLAIEQWSTCFGRFNTKELAGRPCVIGMDLSSNTDITASCLLFPPLFENEKWKAIWRFYLPADDLINRERKDKISYSAWVKDAHLILTPGNVVDYNKIRDDLHRDCKTFNAKAIAFDRWNFEALRQQLISEGIEEDKFVAFGQGFASMSPAMKELEKLIIGQSLIFNNPMILWMAENLAIDTDAAGNIKPTKARSGGRIDGIVALLMALGEAVTKKFEVSPYENYGVLTL